MDLTTDQKTLLRAMLQGYTLKSHRHLDGTKVCRLHALECRDDWVVDAGVVEQLRALDLISSNMKFPAATYLLTRKGFDTASALVEAKRAPLAPFRIE
jgi:hypothetical protein